MQTPNRENNPRHHTQKVIGMYDDLMQHLKEDIHKVDDPQAKALFETAREVIGGLKTAFEHYQAESEQAWRS